MSKALYALADLPYDYKALEPYIDEVTMHLHHDKHHASYVKNLTDALDKHPELYEKSPEELLKNLNDVPEDIRMVVRNNGGGHVNHTMFWQVMAPPSKASVKEGAKGKLLEEIKTAFGSFEEFTTKFNEAGTKKFGSGWVWLVKNKDGKLEIITTANQDNPMSQGTTPIMGNDIWEHAYYLKYKNARAVYLKNWWNVVNWEEVQKRLQP